MIGGDILNVNQKVNFYKLDCENYDEIKNTKRC